MKPFLRMRKLSILFFCLFALHVSAQVDTLSNVEVKASRPEYGKQVFYPSANLTNLGGNLQDVLANIPSIYVAGDGSIQYRGSQSLTIYFDGKPSGILSSSRANALSLFPADRIDYIEIISAPGAKYSAEGSSGILNIVLKKGQASQQIQANLQWGTHDQIASSLRYGNGFKRLSYTFDYNFKQSIRDNYQNLYRENASQYGLAQIQQETFEVNRDYNHAWQSRMEYSLNPKWTLGMQWIARYSEDHNNEARQNLSQFVRAPDRFYIRDADKRGNDKGMDLLISLGTTGKQRTTTHLDFLWIRNLGTDQNDFTQRYFYDGFDIPNSNFPNRIEQSSALSSNYTLLFQGDWETQMTKKLRVDYGFKVTERFFDTDFRYEKLQGEWKLDAKRSNVFTYLERIQAVYGSTRYASKKWDVQGGLRIEATQANLNYVQLFPSLSVQREITKNQQLGLRVTSRVNRPSYKSLNPFISFADPLNLQSGNPMLQPERTYLAEIEHSLDVGTLHTSNQIFYRRVNQLVGRVRTLLEGDTTLTRFENISHSETWGLENITSISPLKNWKVNVTSSVYQTDLQGQVDDQTLSLNRWSWNGRLSQIWNLTPQASVQLSAIYQSAQIHPLGIIQGFYTVDLGFKQEWKSWVLNARVNDVFNTQQTVYDSSPFGYVNDLKKKKETRIFYIGLAFKLSSKKNSGLKNRKSVNEDEAGEED
jgi:iron complex outermembrane recepter protein